MRNRYEFERNLKFEIKKKLDRVQITFPKLIDNICGKNTTSP